MSDQFKQDSLDYHKARNEFDTNGKIGTLITKPCDTEKELSMAYSPGVAYPCKEIEEISKAHTTIPTKATS